MKPASVRYSGWGDRRGTVVYVDSTIARVQWDGMATHPTSVNALQHVSAVDALANVAREDE